MGSDVSAAQSGGVGPDVTTVAVDTSIAPRPAAGAGPVPSGVDEHKDGPLRSCGLRAPYGCCALNGTLYVADSIAHTVRAVDVLRWSPSDEWSSRLTVAEQEAQYRPLIAETVPSLPKELMALTLSYACTPPAAVRTVAGVPDKGGMDTSEGERASALLTYPLAIAPDLSDERAGPSLIIAEGYQLLRRLHLRTGLIEPVARLSDPTNEDVRYVDGPAACASAVRPQCSAGLPPTAQLAVGHGAADHQTAAPAALSADSSDRRRRL
jgi:hypothetical protein